MLFSLRLLSSSSLFLFLLSKCLSFSFAAVIFELIGHKKPAFWLLVTQMAVNFFRLVFKNSAIDIRYKKRTYMNKIGEREPYSSRIFAVVACEQVLSGYGEARREKEILPLFPFPPLEPRGIFLAGYLIRLAVNSFFAARELQQITLSIASLPLNCFVNLAPLGLYFCLIFSLVPKTIHRETQLKLVQQTNTRNWRTCV